MRFSRRDWLLGAAATLASPLVARAQQQTDGAGRPIILTGTASRVFPAGPPAAILLYTLAPEAMLGWTRANRTEDCAFLRADSCARPEVGRIIGRGNTANLEVVAGLRPDLILDAGSTSNTYVSLADRVQQQTGIPYILIDGTLESTPASYRLLGPLLGQAERGEALARYAERTLAQVRERVATVPAEQRPRVYYGRGPRGLETALGGSINIESLRLLGARNVADERAGGLSAVSAEQVLLWNPDVVVTIDADFAALMKRDPVWSQVAAVRAGRAYLSPSRPFGWIDFPPSVNRLIGLWWLGKILYPAQFPEDMTALAREFYALFYGVTPTDAQLASVLAGRA